MSPVLCFPHAGAGIAAFAGWRAEAPAGIDVWPVRLPGRDGNTRPACHRMGELVPAVLEQVAPELDGPFALFGHSLGAVVAFELARELVARGRPPSLLIVSGSAAPGRLAAAVPPQHTLDDEAFLAAVQRWGGTPANEAGRAALNQRLPILRADFELAETYAYEDGPPLSVPVSAVAGSNDHSAGDLREWAAYTSGTFRSRIIPGDHFYLTSARPILLRAIAADVASE